MPCLRCEAESTMLVRMNNLYTCNLCFDCFNDWLLLCATEGTEEFDLCIQENVLQSCFKQAIQKSSMEAAEPWQGQSGLEEELARLSVKIFRVHHRLLLASQRFVKNARPKPQQGGKQCENLWKV